MGLFSKGGYQQSKRHRRQTARHQLKKIREAVWLLVWLGLFFAAAFAVLALFLKNPDRARWLGFSLFYTTASVVLAVVCGLLHLIELKVYAR